MLTQSCSNVGPPSTTLAQHQTCIVSTHVPFIKHFSWCYLSAVNILSENYWLANSSFNDTVDSLSLSYNVADQIQIWSANGHKGIAFRYVIFNKIYPAAVCNFIKHFSLRCFGGVYFKQFYKALLAVALQRGVVLLSFFSLRLFCGVHHKEPPLSR